MQATLLNLFVRDRKSRLELSIKRVEFEFVSYRHLNKKGRFLLRQCSLEASGLMFFKKKKKTGFQMYNCTDKWVYFQLH